MAHPILLPHHPNRSFTAINLPTRHTHASVRPPPGQKGLRRSQSAAGSNPGEAITPLPSRSYPPKPIKPSRRSNRGKQSENKTSPAEVRHPLRSSESPPRLGYVPRPQTHKRLPACVHPSVYDPLRGAVDATARTKGPSQVRGD